MIPVPGSIVRSNNWSTPPMGAGWLPLTRTVEPASWSSPRTRFAPGKWRRLRCPEPLAHTAFAADGAYMGGVTGSGSDDEHLAVMAVGDTGFTWRSPERTRATRRLLFLENPSRVVVFGETAVVYDHTDGH